MNPKSKNRTSTVLQGQAGVYRVASELMVRGMLPCIPTSDTHGVDLILESGVKIQVKTACLTTSGNWTKALYRFSLGRSRYSTITKKFVNKGCIHSAQCDFVILWGVDEHKFWIVPAQLLDGRFSVALGTDPWYKDFDVNVVRDLKAQGHSQNAIAKELGIDQATVSRRLQGKFTDPKNILAQQVRPCENAWHLIQGLELSRQPQGKLIEMPAAKAVASIGA